MNKLKRLRKADNDNDILRLAHELSAANDTSNEPLTINQLRIAISSKDNADLLQWLQSPDTRLPELPVQLNASVPDLANIPNREWLVESWIPASRVTLLSGTGGSGKSKLVLQLCAALASIDNQMGEGMEPNWFGGCHGLPVSKQQATVVYATWEDEPDEISRRLLSWPALKLNDQHPPQATKATLFEGQCADRLQVVDMAGLGAIWGQEVGMHISTRAQMTPAGNALLDFVTEHNARLLVIDPIAAAFGGNENERSAVREFMTALDRFGRDNNCAVIVISHPPKSDADYSGSTDWHAAARSVLKFERTPIGEKPKLGKDSRKCVPQLSHIKSSYSKTQRSIQFDPESWQWWESYRPPEESDGPQSNDDDDDDFSGLDL